MKQLICAKEIEDYAVQGQKTLEIQADAIVTPAAQDAAKEYGITIKRSSDLDEEFIYRFFQMLSEQGMPAGFLETLGMPDRCCEKDPGGMVLVHEDAVVYQQQVLDQCSKPVLGKTVLTEQQAGYLKLEHSEMTWNTSTNEMIVVLDGEAELDINGRKYVAKKEDVLYIPEHTRASWQVKDQVKLFYTAYRQ